jgi:hypothetical protein
MSIALQQRTNRTSTRAFLSKMSRSSATITKSQSSLSLKRSPTFPVLRTGITVMDLQKIISRILHPLVSPKFFLCIGITYLSLFLSDLFISYLLSSSCALVFRLGQNLSNIPRSILSKQKFPLILPLSEHKALRSYLFSSDQTSLLSTELHKSSRILRTTDNRSTHKAFSFLQFPTITVSGPDNGTICWHRGRPRVQHFNNAPTKP